MSPIISHSIYGWLIFSYNPVKFKNFKSAIKSKKKRKKRIEWDHIKNKCLIYILKLLWIKFSKFCIDLRKIDLQLSALD